MRVLYLATTCSTFVVGHADTFLVVDGQVNATPTTQSTFPRLYGTVAHSNTPRVLLSDDLVGDGVTHADRDTEERVSFPWIRLTDSMLAFRQREWQYLGLDAGEVFQRICVHSSIGADKRALRVWLEHVKWIRDDNARRGLRDKRATRSDHLAALEILQRHWSLENVAEELVRALGYESVKSDVKAMLRIVADDLPASSVALPKKMEELKVTPEDAFGILGLARSNALVDHPGAVIQWLRRIILLSKRSAAERTKKMIKDQRMMWWKWRRVAASNERSTNAFVAKKATERLLKTNGYGEVGFFLSMVESVPDMKAFATTMRQCILREQQAEEEYQMIMVSLLHAMVRNGFD